MKYILLIIFFAHLSFGEDESVDLDITGKWILAAVETEENEIKDQIKPGSATMEFKGDGTFSFTFSGRNPSNGTYTIGRENITILCSGWEKGPMKYVLVNNTIKINVVNATWITFNRSNVAPKPVLTTDQILLTAENSGRELGSLLIKSLVNNDFKTYQSCWVTLDYFNKTALEFGFILSEDDSKQKKVEFEARDADIKESFEKITSLFKEVGITAENISNYACEPFNISNIEGHVGCSMFNISYLYLGKEWKIFFGEGVIINEKWYLADSPSNLFAEGKILSFRDNRKSK